MSVDGINVQTMGTASLNTERTELSDVSPQSVSNAVSLSISKAIVPAGDSVSMVDKAGRKYVFTPYFSAKGEQLVRIATTSANGVQGNKSIRLEQLDSYCSRNGLTTPKLVYHR